MMTDAQRLALWLRQQCPTAGCTGDSCQWHEAATLLEVLGEVASAWDAMLDTAERTIHAVDAVLESPPAMRGRNRWQAAATQARAVVSIYLRGRHGDRD